MKPKTIENSNEATIVKSETVKSKNVKQRKSNECNITVTSANEPSEKALTDFYNCLVMLYNKYNPNNQI